MKKEEAMELAGECLEDLAHALNEPCTVEVQRYLNAIAVFHRYSLNNILMILAQAPEASLVAGFHSWRKLGRFVKADRIRSTAGRILCLLEEAERSRAVATETAGVESITYADETGFDAILHEMSYGHAYYDLERIETSEPHPDVTDRFIREVRVQYIASEATPFQIKKAEDVADFVRSVMIDNSREQFFALYLDGKHAVVSYSLISIGTANSAPVHPREVFQRAILSGAIAVVVAHNHPSGSSDASQADRRVTSELRAAGKLLEIQLLDHVIVTQSGCHSLREELGW